MRITGSLNLGSDDRPGGRSLTKMRAVVQILRLDGKKEKQCEVTLPGLKEGRVEW